MSHVLSDFVVRLPFAGDLNDSKFVNEAAAFQFARASAADAAGRIISIYRPGAGWVVDRMWCDDFVKLDKIPDGEPWMVEFLGTPKVVSGKYPDSPNFRGELAALVKTGAEVRARAHFFASVPFMGTRGRKHVLSSGGMSEGNDLLENLRLDPPFSEGEYWEVLVY